MRYLRRCVEAESASALLPLDSKRWSTLPLDPEPAFHEGAREVPSLPELERLTGLLKPGQSLFYGWPAVVLRGKVAPLFMVELARPTERTAGLPLLEEPALNPGLVTEEHFDPSVVAEVRARVGNRIPVGGSAAMRALMQAVAGMLGLAIRAPGEWAAPGLYDVPLVVLAESVLMNRALMEDLRTLEARTDWRGTAAAWLLGVEIPPAKGQDAAPAAPLVLNRSQEDVARALRDQPLTVVTGPPGTGKSQVVVAAVANAWLQGETVLLASTNNAAVDVAADRARQVHPGMVLRTGNSEFRERLPAVISDLTSRVRAAGPVDEPSARRDLGLALKARLDTQRAIERRSHLHVELLAQTEAEQDAARRSWSGPPPPGTAPEVVGPKAERLVRAWFFAGLRRRWYLRKLQTVEGARIEDLADWARAALAFRKAEAELGTLRGEDRTDLEAAEKEWGRASVQAVVAAVTARLSGHLRELDGLGQARLAGGGIPKAVRDAMSGALGWACTALSVKQNFPLHPGLFDLVLVDEASQCTLAAVLPLAYRARRLAIVGDPSQLNPVVHLDDVRLEGLAAACGFTRSSLEEDGLDHGRGSAFAAYARRAEPLLLDEHYRCHPLIARWFNQCFYGGSLVVLTDVGAFPPGRRGLFWEDVAGESAPGPAGSLINEQEAEAVVQFLRTELDSGSSLGVVTPFAAQARLIRSRVERAFPRDALGAVDFTSGTAHRFQGDERDLVVFSPVLAPNTKARTAEWVEKQRHLLNVAASRARRALVVFGHPEPGIPTLASLREAGIAGARPDQAAWNVHSESEGRLRDALWALGLSPILKPLVDGFELDLALGRLNVEVDGPTHVDTRGRQCARDVARDRVLEGLGWKVLRVPAWRCLREPQTVAEEVRQALTQGLSTTETGV